MPVSYTGGAFQQPQAKVKVLAATVLASTAAAVYTVPSGCSGTEISTITVYNNNGSATDLDIWVQTPGGTQYQIYRSASIATVTHSRVLSPSDGGPMFLRTGYSLYFEASQGADVDCVVTGIEYFLPQGGASA